MTMEEKELRESAKCAACGKPFGHTGLPMFYRVTIERFGLSLDAINRLDGLAMFFGGNAALTSAFSPDEDLAIKIGEPVTITICETCSTENVMIAALAERP